jgi:hypothetical protein
VVAGQVIRQIKLEIASNGIAENEIHALIDEKLGGAAGKVRTSWRICKFLTLYDIHT